MAIGDGAGTAISFSQIRDFYNGSNPVNISDYNRGGDRVRTTFAGSETVTNSSGPQTVDDFGITQTTQTVYTGNPGSFANRAGESTNNAFTVVTDSYTVNAGDSVISLGGAGYTDFGGENNIQVVNGFQLSVNGGSSTSYGGSFFYFKGPAWQNGHHPSILAYTGGFSAGQTITLTTTSGNHSGFVTLSSSRVSPSTLYDLTFTNNSNTGDTYTLTSDSTGASLRTVYGPGVSQLVRDNVSNNQFVIAYDNVTGAGPGSAGDIGVSIIGPNYTGSLGSVTARAIGTPPKNYTVTADDAVIQIIGDTADGGGNSGGNVTVKHRINSGTEISQSGFDNTQNGAAVNISYYTGPAASGATGSGTNNGTLSAGDVINYTHNSGESGSGIYSRRRSARYTTRFTNNSSTKSYTLGGSSTGGAASISANATRDVNPTATSSNPDWAIHFNTASGSCNTNVPGTIGSGNPVNLDIFNDPGTPIG